MLAQVAQEMPETDQSATDFVIEGDTALMAAQEEVHASEQGDDGERMANAYMALHDAGAQPPLLYVVLYDAAIQATCNYGGRAAFIYHNKNPFTLIIRQVIPAAVYT